MLDVLLQLAEKAPVSFELGHRGQPGPEAARLPGTRAAGTTCRDRRGFHILEQDTYSVVKPGDPGRQDHVLAVLAAAPRCVYTVRRAARVHQDRAGPPPRRPGQHLLPQPVLPREAAAACRRSCSATTASTSSSARWPTSARTTSRPMPRRRVPDHPVQPVRLAGEPAAQAGRRCWRSGRRNRPAASRPCRARWATSALAVERPDAVRLPRARKARRRRIARCACMARRGCDARHRTDA